MPKYRLFVELTDYENWILRVIQNEITKARKKKAPMGKVLGAIIREYWSDIEKNMSLEDLERIRKEVPPPTVVDQAMSVRNVEHALRRPTFKPRDGRS